jgi:diacylglycerol O-acyltransferase / wax synthase
VWADDEAFDLDWHLDHATLPPPDALPDWRPSTSARSSSTFRPSRSTSRPRDESWSPRPYDPGAHIARLAATPFVRAQQLAMDTALRPVDTSPGSAAEDLRKATDLLVELARQRPQAPMTPLNEPLGPNRRYATARAGLGAVKAAGMAMGEMGNRIPMVFVDLPTQVDDPAVRVQRVSAETRALKGSAAVRAGGLIAGATGWVPPAVSSLLVRAMGGVRAHNLVFSNVPGPQQPF